MPKRGRTVVEVPILSQGGVELGQQREHIRGPLAHVVALLVHVALVGARAENVIFTSGATEANNQALRCCGRPKVIASATEHPSVLEVSPEAARIPVSADGVTDLDASRNC